MEKYVYNYLLTAYLKNNLHDGPMCFFLKLLVSSFCKFPILSENSFNHNNKICGFRKSKTTKKDLFGIYPISWLFLE